MKLKHIALIGSLFPILFSLVLFFGVLISADSDDENSNFSSGITGMNLSAEVLKHQPMVEKYARENGISEYVNVLLAIIQVESGGTAEDVMQSSESLGLPPNSLDTESSIKQGCKYFASLLSSCKNQGIDDLNVAIQSYNYGGGYVGYVAGNEKKTYIQFGGKFRKRKIGWKESNLHQSDSRCEKWWLALELWKYVLCGISQSVFSCTAGIGRAGTKGHE